jgi:hypothetical protein
MLARTQNGIAVHVEEWLRTITVAGEPRRKSATS